MSTTPRTDAAYFRQGATMYDLARESKKLETELADAKLDAEDQAKWALWYLARAEKAEAELAHLRAQEPNDYIKLIAEVLKCNPRPACDQLDNQLEAPWEVVARLRADLERFTGHGLLDCHQICDQRDAAVAELAAEREKVRVLRDALELITNQADACKAFCDTFTPSSRIKAFAALDATKEDSK